MATNLFAGPGRLFSGVNIYPVPLALLATVFLLVVFQRS